MTNIEQTVQQAGLTTAQVAKKCRVGHRYWRSVELHGKAPLVLAKRAARVLGCSANILLFPSQPTGQTVQALKQQGPIRPSIERLEPAQLLLKEGGAKTSAAPRARKRRPKLALV